jgi:G3E family GTPase
MKTVRLIFVGGFLGAGKTTLVLRLAHWLGARGRRVAIVTNPRAARASGSPLAQAEALTINKPPAGCLCCPSDGLEKTLRKLKVKMRPDIVIAEPVGSCSDIMTAVVRPLCEAYGLAMEFAPFSVVVDPFNMLQVLGLVSNRGFSPEIVWILRRQMEQAQIITLNKIDVFPPGKRKRIEAAAVRQFPKATLCSISARTGEGCERWFELAANAKAAAGPVIDADYERYARGPQLLSQAKKLETIVPPSRLALQPQNGGLFSLATGRPAPRQRQPLNN